jgi:hypothetical protein
MSVANAEGSVQKSTKAGEASMESSVVTHLARWNCLLRVLSYRSMECQLLRGGASEYE